MKNCKALWELYNSLPEKRGTIIVQKWFVMLKKWEKNGKRCKWIVKNQLAVPRKRISALLVVGDSASAVPVIVFDVQVKCKTPESR